jgi:hypothetical protein
MGKQVKNAYVENRFCYYGFFRRRNSSLGYQRQTKLLRKSIGPFSLRSPLAKAVTI